MKSKLFILVLSCLLVLSLVLASCGTKTTPTTIPSKTISTTIATPTKPTTSITSISTTKPTQTQASEVPKYGGTFTYRTTADPISMDPYVSYATILQSVYEVLSMDDFKTDRNLWDFKIAATPLKYRIGMLAESWEISPDFKAFTFHIRKGIHWQDIPPANGREFTASDVEFTFHRELGLGSGFSKPSQWVNVASFAWIKSVTATDKYTVVFSLTEPSYEQLRYLLYGSYMGIVNREAVEKWGDLLDWKHAIGTGPFILTDYVSGSSIITVKNPNYWRYDESFPKNRLPYLDRLKMLIIPDNATAYAALRSGKIDMVESVNWNQAASLKQTNPELRQENWPQNSWVIHFHVDEKPFNDIKVRKAMQMAMDIPSIAKNFYGGNAVGTPMGLIGVKGYYTPFEQWPQNVKDGYTYNPAEAKKLLTEAGYPNGFKCTLTASNIHDLDLYQILKAYLFDVGIDMTIQVMDNTSWTNYTRSDKHQMMSGQFGCFAAWPAEISINHRWSGQYFFRHHIKDPHYEELWAKVKTSLDGEEQKKIIIEMDAYATAQQWAVTMPPFYTYVIWQPWLKYYNGEWPTNTGVLGAALTAKLWID